MNPDFERAREYMLGRLERELSPHLTYHSLCHTRDDVLPAVVRLGLKTDVDEESLLLLSTAALFHDSGFLYTYNDHERESIGLASAVLPGFDYAPDQVDCIIGLIAATRMPQRPQSLLQQLICDADLDVLGRDDFWNLNRKLLSELHYFTNPALGEEEWLQGQARFLQEHEYFSPAAHALRDLGKARNLALMRDALRSLNGSHANPTPAGEADSY